MCLFFSEIGSVQFSCSVMSDSLWPHEQQHIRPPKFVHHELPGFTQTHVLRVGDAIQPSHPLLSPSPPSLNLSQHQGLFNESPLRIRWPRYWSFSFSISPSKEHPGLISLSPLGWTGWISLQSKGLSRVFSNTTLQKHQFFWIQLSL